MSRSHLARVLACLVLSFSASVSAWAVKPEQRHELARARQNQTNIYAFPYLTPLEKIGAEEPVLVARIRFMSDTAENEFAVRKDPEHPTVLDLAEALKKNPAEARKLPAILVWEDTAGRIFTIDHRRLIAAKLAEVETIQGRWATPDEIRNEHFKFTTKNLGRSIELLFSDGRPPRTINAATAIEPGEHEIDEALQFALEAHGDQRYGEHPYSYHLAAVASVLRRFGYVQPKYQIAALLHDTIEDTRTTYEDIQSRFGKGIADIVWAVTNGPGKDDAEQWENTYPKTRANPDALIVKLADRIANTEESIYGPKQGRLGKLSRYQKKWAEFAGRLRAAGDKTGMWDYLEKLTWDERFAETQLPSTHQQACEIALVAYPDLVERYRKR